MIRVTHNDREVPGEAAGLRHLGELVGRALGADPTEPRVAVKVSVDGIGLSPEALDRLDERPLDGVHEVAIESVPLREVALDSLESAGGYALQVRDALQEVAGGMREGRADEVDATWKAATDALHVLAFTLEAAAGALGERADTLRRFGRDLEPWVEGVIEAQARSDWIRLADLLEYEVAPRLAEIPEDAESIRRAFSGS